ncbi:MAG TPA: 6-bladed beta-propeller [Gemmatimonadaceae bacterium]|nr:6-bladed beta-propeller [Gemmatimonadaceae bacterium]
MRIAFLVLVTALAAGASSAATQQVVPLGDRDIVLDWRPQELFRVGENETRAEEQFARVAATAFDRNDNLYVLDADNHRVVVFDRGGRFVREFGRRGNGPGEFGVPMRLAVTADDHLVVHDAANRALIVFTLDGRHVRNLPLDSDVGLGGVRFFAAHPQGGVVFAMMPAVMMRQGTPDIDTAGLRLWWQKSLAEGAKPTLLRTVPEAEKRAPPEVRRDGNRVMVMQQAPPAFTPDVHFGLLGDAVVFNRTADYALNTVDESGNVGRVLRRPFSPRRVTERDKETERQRRLEALRLGPAGQVIVFGGGGAGAPPRSQDDVRRAQEANIRTLQFAEMMPVVRGLSSDDRGRLWVWRYTDQPGQPGVIDILAPDGRYLGTLRDQPLPSSVSRSGLAAYVTVSDLETPMVVVRRLPPEGG